MLAGSLAVTPLAALSRFALNYEQVLSKLWKRRQNCKSSNLIYETIFNLDLATTMIRSFLMIYWFLLSEEAGFYKRKSKILKHAFFYRYLGFFFLGLKRVFFLIFEYYFFSWSKACGLLFLFFLGRKRVCLLFLLKSFFFKFSPKCFWYIYFNILPVLGLQLVQGPKRSLLTFQVYRKVVL